VPFIPRIGLAFADETLMIFAALAFTAAL